MKTGKKTTTILLVDDSPDTLEVLQRNLSSQGYKVFTAQDAEQATSLLSSEKVDLLITDYKMPGVNGMDLLRYMRENYHDVDTMMITGYATIENAVSAMKTGAREYLPKPFTDQELFDAVRRVLKKRKMKKLANNKTSKNKKSHFGLIGNSEPMSTVFDSIEKCARTDANVLICGESGTGKELVARAIHYNSPRASAAFIPVNCGAIPENLLESELFGHVRGAFTGATATRAGFFQTAEGGTVFLDEISDTIPSMQAKLLRVLESKEVTMVGSSRPRMVDVRIIAATNKDLFKMVEDGLFRKDLFYRLNVININLPPLCERGDDVLLLAINFAEKFAGEMKRSIPEFTGEALEVLKNYNWPGNVRELENIIQRAIVLNDSQIIDVHDLPPHMRYSYPIGEKVNKPLSSMEAEHIRNVLIKVKGNKSEAAKILGIDRTTLRNKIKKYGL